MGAVLAWAAAGPACGRISAPVSTRHVSPGQRPGKQRGRSRPPRPRSAGEPQAASGRGVSLSRCARSGPDARVTPDERGSRGRRRLSVWRGADYRRIMLKRRIVLPPEHLYPADEWRIVEARYSDEFVGLTETVFSLGNGFVGVRGSFEEGRPALVPGTFVNGFHETWPIVHAEGAPALARTGQTIVNVPDTTIIKLYVDDEPFFLPTARLQEYRRILDMRAGTLARELVWATAAGKHVRVRSRRMVSLEHRHLVAMTYEVTMLDEPAPVVVSSLVLNRQDARQAGHLPEYRPGDPRLATVLPQRVLNVRPAELAGQRILLGYQTTSSGMTLGVGVDHVIDAACSSQAVRSLDDETGEVLLTADAVPGVPIRITKYATYQTSRSIPVPELVER